jgi:hypothetical protein
MAASWCTRFSSTGSPSMPGEARRLEDHVTAAWPRVRHMIGLLNVDSCIAIVEDKDLTF